MHMAVLLIFNPMQSIHSQCEHAMRVCASALTKLHQQLHSSKAVGLQGRGGRERGQRSSPRTLGYCVVPGDGSAGGRELACARPLARRGGAAPCGRGAAGGPKGGPHQVPGGPAAVRGAGMRAARTPPRPPHQVRPQPLVAAECARARSLAPVASRPPMQGSIPPWCRQAVLCVRPATML